MKPGSFYPALIGVGVLFAFYASGAPSAKLEKSGAVAKPTSAFFSKLESASGEYRVLKGLEDPKCSEGMLGKFSGAADTLILGTNILIRNIDQPESVEKDGSCEIRHSAKSSGAAVTSVDRFFCDGKLQKTVTAKLEISGDQILYSDGESNCVYKRAPKAAGP